MEETLLAAKRKLERATERFDHQVEAVAQVAAVIEEILETHRAEAPHAVSKRRPTAEMNVLREEARTGATALTFEWNVDGSAEVRINGRAPFRLQPKPALLLHIIASPGGRAAGDSLVGWRTYAEVATQLDKNGGRTASRHSVAQTIHRLRTSLQHAGQNWLLVQTDRRGATRFAIRRDAAETLATATETEAMPS